MEVSLVKPLLEKLRNGEMPALRELELDTSTDQWRQIVLSCNQAFYVGQLAQRRE